MNNNFKEKLLGDDFCKSFYFQVSQLLNPTGFFTITGIPGVGISFFLRYLATREFANFIYLDVLSLTTINKEEFFKALYSALGGENVEADGQELIILCQKMIKQQTLQHENQIIILFNRFDELGEQIDKNLLGNLRTLRHIASDKVSMIFVMHKEIFDISPESLGAGNLDMFSNILYFKPYLKKDLIKLIELHSPEILGNQAKIDLSFELSGGHFQLFKMLLKTEGSSKGIKDRTIKLALEMIYQNLNTHQKKIIHNLTFGKIPKEIDPQLLSNGYITYNNGTYNLFSPLLSEFFIAKTPEKMSIKEARLFRLLKKKLGKLVLKDEIFSTVWMDCEEEYKSDWALNSLIYRLRKNSSIINSGYIIESHKKAGYLMIKV